MTRKVYCPFSYMHLFKQSWPRVNDAITHFQTFVIRSLAQVRQFPHTCHAVIEKIMNYLRLTETLFTARYFRSKNPSILQPFEIPFP